MKFRLMLWALAFLMGRASKKNESFRKQLEGQRLTFQIRSLNGASRVYTVKDLQVTSRSGSCQNPTFDIAFQTPEVGFDTFTAKNTKLAFMEGIQAKKIMISGEFPKVIWFQGLIKYLLPKKKKA
ncbi:MAG: helicase [Endozoicomonas sp. (ex Botrylloides leachii)]|nr:helicase [Endozoicomonas sp. (ex Botrylloides leachii)]